MIATELALAVAYPMQGNIGGGYGISKANGELTLDYREKSTFTASKDMF
jgi:gamma-glutamyltranspeptidase/glutathione hydrolase